MKKSPSFDSSLQKAFPSRLLKLWPAFKGSLAKVYKPCIRPHCSLCAKGIKHSAYIFSFTDRGKRRCLYVPKELIPLFKKALKNGRHIENYLYQAASEFILKYRQKRKQTRFVKKRR